MPFDPISIAVVRGHDEQRVGTLPLKLKANLQRFVKSNHIVESTGSVAIVAAMVNATALDLENETRNGVPATSAPIPS